MDKNGAYVLSLEEVKAFRRDCEEYVDNLRKGLTHLVKATEWVHEGNDGWDDDDYFRIKARVEGIVTGMQAIRHKITADLLPYVDNKIRVLERKPGC